MSNLQADRVAITRARIDSCAAWGKPGQHTAIRLRAFERANIAHQTIAFQVRNRRFFDQRSAGNRVCQRSIGTIQFENRIAVFAPNLSQLALELVR